MPALRVRVKSFPLRHKRKRAATANFGMQWATIRTVSARLRAVGQVMQAKGISVPLQTLAGIMLFRSQCMPYV